MENKKIKHIYPIVLQDDKSLKQFMDRFYVLAREPKGYEYTEEEKKFLEKYCLELSEPREREGKDGFIVYRKKKKLNPEQVEVIKNDTGNQRAKAKKYGLSVGTINKIMNDKY